MGNTPGALPLAVPVGGVVETLARLCPQLREWVAGTEAWEEPLDVPGDLAALAGEIETDAVDAEPVVVVRQQVSGELVDLFAA
ncbi:hypothetical protein [Streptomyces sp. NPDC048644]|uniref:hypothetical protein n=1 Tax=Streptomyces sp. NPDC048644 TaxID=3365582 RepID=UPI003714001F